MTEDRYPQKGPDPVLVDQARAWAGVTDPLLAQRWDDRREVAELDDNIGAYYALGYGIIDLWRDERDAPLDPVTRQIAEHEQGIAWLGPHARVWLHAHTLAVDRDEFDADFQLMLPHWRQHREDTTVPDALVHQLEALEEERKGRVTAAKGWFQRHDPRYLSEWQMSRDFADSLEESWGDDRQLVSRHRAELKAALAVKNPPIQPPSAPARARSQRNMQPGVLGLGRSPKADPGPRRRQEPRGL